MPAAAVGTIVAKNFVPFARVLARSFSQFHSDVPFFVAIADEADGTVKPGHEPFETIALTDLGIPDLGRLCFRYSRQQLSIVVKPYLLRHLLSRGFSAALFLDADVLVTDSLDPLFDASADHSIALTPHLLAPLRGDGGCSRELNILLSGIYNGGCLGVSGRDSGCRFLNWWADRLHTHCRHDPMQGMHYDQRWLDLVPALFDDVFIVRDAGCNVAYWNLPERGLTLTNGRFEVVDGPCRFFHFSGFEPDRPMTVTRYSSRLAMENIGQAAALFARYVDLLRADGYFEWSRSPYAFGSFDNGVAIPDIARRLYQDMGDTVHQFGNPFHASAPNSYFHWLNEPADDGSATDRISRIWHAVYLDRPDLQQAFPELSGTGSSAYRAWIAARGLGEYQVDEAFAP